MRGAKFWWVPIFRVEGKDNSILGSTFGSTYFGKLPNVNLPTTPNHLLGLTESNQQTCSAIEV